jgi:asparagine synthase (glutamine-hydrolysing)
VTERLYKLLGFALPRVESFRDEYFKLRDMARSNDFNAQYLALLSQIAGEDLRQLGLTGGHPLNFRTDELNFLQSMMLTDFQMFLPDDILVKVDRATMGVALEGREPFLDNKLIEFAVGLPMKYKLIKGVSKSILRDILYRYVPRAMVERPKQGFAIPVEDWFRSDLANLFNEYVNPERIRKEDLLEPTVVERWKSDFVHRKIKINTKLWYLLIFEIWAERWLG